MRQAGAAPGERRVVGHAGIEAEQGHKRAQQALGLPPGLTKGQAQQAAGLDRQVRIVARATVLARVGRMPGRLRLGRYPDRQAPTLLQRPVILRPVGDLVARPWNLVTARLIGRWSTNKQPHTPATHASKAYKLRITHQRSLGSYLLLYKRTPRVFADLVITPPVPDAALLGTHAAADHRQPGPNSRTSPDANRTHAAEGMSAAGHQERPSPSSRSSAWPSGSCIITALAPFDRTAAPG